MTALSFLNYKELLNHCLLLFVPKIELYTSHLKMRVSVGIKSDLGKALIANNSGSIVKINNAV